MIWTCSSEPYLTPQSGGAADAWTQAGGTQRITGVGEATPPGDVAAALGIHSSDPAIVRTRLLSLGGDPYELAASWWPASIAAGTALAEPRRIKGGAVTLLAEMGYTVARTIEDIWAAPASGESTLLDIQTGAPVLVIFRTAFDANGTAFQVDVMTRRALARQRYQIAAN